MSIYEASGAQAHPTHGSRRAFLRRTVGGGATVITAALWASVGRRLDAAVRRPRAEATTRRIARIIHRYGPEFGRGRRP